MRTLGLILISLCFSGPVWAQACPQGICPQGSGRGQEATKASGIDEKKNSSDQKSAFPIFGFFEDQNGMAFQVGPDACSDKSFYAPEVHLVEEGVYKGVAELTFVQKSGIENCQIRDRNQWIHFDYAELKKSGVKNIFVAIKNPRGFLHSRQIQFSTEDAPRGTLPIFGYKSDEENISILVASGGCTDRSNFELEVSAKSDSVGDYNQITFIKAKGDGCESGPMKVWIQFPFDEIGIDGNETFTVTNPHPLVFSRIKIVN